MLDKVCAFRVPSSVVTIEAELVSELSEVESLHPVTAAAKANAAVRKPKDRLYALSFLISIHLSKFPFPAVVFLYDCIIAYEYEDFVIIFRNRGKN